MNYTMTKLSMLVGGLSTTLAMGGEVDIGPAASILGENTGSNVTTFNLFDHPGGAADPQAYGLRLDSFTNSGSPVTFSFEDGDGNSTVQLHVVESNGDLTLNISGMVWGNSSDGGTDFGSFMLDLSYEISSVGDGWEDNNANDGQMIGGLSGLNTTLDSPLGDGEFMALSAKSDGSDSFRFLADGFRLDNSTDAWVGRGWVMSDFSTGQGFDDLLFVAQIVPLPPAVMGGIAMLLGMGVARRRMRTRMG